MEVLEMFYKIIDKQNDTIYAAKVSIYEMEHCSEDTILNLSREIDIISKINHPSILIFIGFFKNKSKPVIITEFANNGSLEDILQKERIGLANYDWDDTKKLINICEKEEATNFYTANISKIKKILSHNLTVISQLNHPSLLKFIGFSLIDFKEQRKPVIVTEFFTNGVLEQILDLEKMNKKISGWDKTKKLINIYGIASGLSYMHSHNILHCCLSPSNVYLDDILCPKIGDFGLYARLVNTNDMKNQSMSGAKGTLIYTAPEVLESNVYSKASDVYSFALVVYEILSNEKLFTETDSISLIYNKIVVKGERPLMNDSIPDRFKKLIEQ